MKDELLTACCRTLFGPSRQRRGVARLCRSLTNLASRRRSHSPNSALGTQTWDLRDSGKNCGSCVAWGLTSHLSRAPVSEMDWSEQCAERSHPSRDYTLTPPSPSPSPALAPPATAPHRASQQPPHCTGRHSAGSTVQVRCSDQRHFTGATSLVHLRGGRDSHGVAQRKNTRSICRVCYGGAAVVACAAFCVPTLPYHINDEEGQQNHEDAHGHQTRLARWRPSGRPGWLQCTLCPGVTAAESNISVQADHLRSEGHSRKLLLTEVQANLRAATSSSQPAAADLTPRQMQLRAVDAMWSHINDTDMRCDCCLSFSPIHKNNVAAQQSHVAGQRHIKAYEKYRQSFAMHGGAASSAGQPPDPRHSSSGPPAASSVPSSSAAASPTPSVWILGDRERWLQCRVCRVFIRAVHTEAKDSHVAGEQHRKALAKLHGSHSSQGCSSASAAGQPPDPRKSPVSACAPALRMASAVPPGTLGIPPQKLKKNQLNEWFNNKRGVGVTLPPELPDLGRFMTTQIPIVCVGQEAVFSVQVQSSVAPTSVLFKRCRLVHLDQRKPLEKMRPEADKAFTINSPLPAQLPSNTPLHVDLRVKPMLNKGRVSTHLLLEFEDSSSSFVIIRSITVRMASADEAQLAASSASGSSSSNSNGSTGSGSNDQLPKKRLSSWERRLAYAKKRKDDREVVPAPPVDGRGVKPVVPLKRYDLPGYLRREMPSPQTKAIISNVEVRCDYAALTLRQCPIVPHSLPTCLCVVPGICV